MRLSWNEVRVRAASFAKAWRDAAYEKGETQSFYNDFFEVFDVRRRSVHRASASRRCHSRTTPRDTTSTSSQPLRFS